MEFFFGFTYTEAINYLYEAERRECKCKEEISRVLGKKSMVTNQSFCLGWSLQKLTSACQAYVCVGRFCGEKAKLLLLWSNIMHAFFPSKVREVKRGVKMNWALNRAKQTGQKTCILYLFEHIKNKKTEASLDCNPLPFMGQHNPKLSRFSYK